MSVRIEEPKTLGIKDMFLFWARNLLREKPYYRAVNLKWVGGGQNATIYSSPKKERAYLTKQILIKEEELMALEEEERDKPYITKNLLEQKKELYAMKRKLNKLSNQDDKEIKVIDYRTFAKIVKEFNKRLVQYVIEGDNLSLGNRLGFMRIAKIPKKNMQIDWENSNKYKQELIDQGVEVRTKDNPEGKNWFIFKIYDCYYVWQWVRRYGTCTVKNHRFYEFSTVPSSHFRRGVMSQVAVSIKENPYLEERYYVGKTHKPDEISNLKHYESLK